MQRVQQVIKHFNDYDSFVQELIDKLPGDAIVAKALYQARLGKLQLDTSLTVGKLRRFGCRREQ